VPLVQKWRKLKAAGHANAFCQTIVGISRATYYRYEIILKQPTPSPPSEPNLTLALSKYNLSYGILAG
jgi:ACT domain-containing protein